LSYRSFTGAITLTALDFLGFGMPAGSVAGRTDRPGQTEPASAVAGLTAFFTLALILSLLVFIGEALRDAFDPDPEWS
jgi:ABC-type microcin C transport system permease subunit YejE